MGEGGADSDLMNPWDFQGIFHWQPVNHGDVHRAANEKDWGFPVDVPGVLLKKDKKGLGFKQQLRLGAFCHSTSKVFRVFFCGPGCL